MGIIQSKILESNLSQIMLDKEKLSSFTMPKIEAQISDDRAKLEYC